MKWWLYFTFFFGISAGSLLGMELDNNKNHKEIMLITSDEQTVSYSKDIVSKLGIVQDMFLDVQKDDSDLQKIPLLVTKKEFDLVVPYLQHDEQTKWEELVKKQSTENKLQALMIADKMNVSENLQKTLVNSLSQHCTGLKTETDIKLFLQLTQKVSLPHTLKNALAGAVRPKISLPVNYVQDIFEAADKQKSLTECMDSCESIQFSSNGEWLFFEGHYPDQLYTYNLRKKKKKSYNFTSERTTHILFDDSMSQMIFGCKDGKVCVCDCSDPNNIFIQNLEQDSKEREIISVFLSPKGGFAKAETESKLKSSNCIWDVKNSDLNDFTNNIVYFKWLGVSKNEKFFVCKNRDDELLVYNSANKKNTKPIAKMEMPYQVFGPNIAFSHDESQLVVAIRKASFQDRVYLWECTDSGLKQLLSFYTNLYLREDASLFTNDGICIYSLFIKENDLPKMSSDTSDVGRCGSAFSNDGRYLVLTSWKDKKIYLYDCMNKDNVKLIKSTKFEDKSLPCYPTFSPDSRYLAISGYNKIYLYDLNELNVINTLSLEQLLILPFCGKKQATSFQDNKLNTLFNDLQKKFGLKNQTMIQRITNWGKSEESDDESSSRDEENNSTQITTVLPNSNSQKLLTFGTLAALSAFLLTKYLLTKK